MIKVTQQLEGLDLATTHRPISEDQVQVHVDAPLDTIPGGGDQEVSSVRIVNASNGGVSLQLARCVCETTDERIEDIDSLQRWFGAFDCIRSSTISLVRDSHSDLGNSRVRFRHLDISSRIRHRAGGT